MKDRYLRWSIFGQAFNHVSQFQPDAFHGALSHCKPADGCWSAATPYALRSSPYALRPTLFALRSSPFALRSKRVEPRLDLAARCLDGEAIVGSPWLTDLVQQLFGESLELICLVEQSIGFDQGLIGPLGSVANLHRQ